MEATSIRQWVCDGDLAELLDYAIVAVCDGPGDRLALLQRLLGDPALVDDLDRAEDAVNIAGAFPHWAERTRGWARRLRDEMTDRWGPLALRHVDPADFLFGFLKRATHGRLARPGSLEAPFPPDEHFLAMLQFLLETLVPAIDITRSSFGRRVVWGCFKNCPSCGGLARIPCKHCDGRGLRDDQTIRQAFAHATPYIQQRLAALQAAGALTADAVRAALGPTVSCDRCSGEGGTTCGAAAHVDVPKDAREGWVVAIVRSDGDVLMYRRIQAIKND